MDRLEKMWARQAFAAGTWACGSMDRLEEMHQEQAKTAPGGATQISPALQRWSQQAG